MGKLIVLDGLDGSGKATQTQLFYEWLNRQDTPCHHISFPDYQHKSSTLVQMYLNGEIGSLHEINSYAASSFYSVDRYISYHTIWKEWHQAGHTILADRYTTSNACHQMSKLPQEEWNAFLDWLADFEYGKLGLPTPDLVLYLDMHPDTSRRLLERRYAKEGGNMDIHEQDLAYLQQCRTAALYAASHWGWKVIPCDADGEPLPIETIASQVREVYLSFMGQ